MQIETRMEDGVLYLTPLDHRIEGYLAAAFRAALVDRIDAGAQQITIDLHRVDYLDSAGIGALVSALKRIGQHGQLRIASPKPAVRSLLELTRLNRVIPIVESVPSEAPATAS